MVMIFPALSLLDTLYFMASLNGGICLQIEQQWWPQSKMNLMAGSTAICYCCPQEFHEKLTWYLQRLPTFWTQYSVAVVVCVAFVISVCGTPLYTWGQEYCGRGVDQNIKGYAGCVRTDCMVTPFKMAILLLFLYFPAWPVPAPLTGLSSPLIGLN